MTYFSATVSDEKIQGALDKLSYICGFDVDDGRAESATLEQWEDDSRHWLRRGYFSRHELAGFRAILFEDAQATKGQRKQTILVLDAGEFRIVFAA